jgi:hypothetical protein
MRFILTPQAEADALAQPNSALGLGAEAERLFTGGLAAARLMSAAELGGTRAIPV